MVLGPGRGTGFVIPGSLRGHEWVDPSCLIVEYRSNSRLVAINAPYSDTYLAFLLSRWADLESARVHPFADHRGHPRWLGFRMKWAGSVLRAVYRGREKVRCKRDLRCEPFWGPGQRPLPVENVIF